MLKLQIIYSTIMMSGHITSKILIYVIELRPCDISPMQIKLDYTKIEQNKLWLAL